MITFCTSMTSLKPHPSYMKLPFKVSLNGTRATLSIPGLTRQDVRSQLNQKCKGSQMCLKFQVKKSPEKKSLKFRNCSRSKGAFYFEGDVVISHQLTFKVVKRAEFGLCIQVRIASNHCRAARFDLPSFQPLPECEIPVDCQLFLFKFGKELDASPNSRMQFMGKSPLFIPDSNVHPTW